MSRPVFHNVKTTNEPSSAANGANDPFSFASVYNDQYMKDLSKISAIVDDLKKKHDFRLYVLTLLPAIVAELAAMNAPTLVSASAQILGTTNTYVAQVSVGLVAFAAVAAPAYILSGGRKCSQEIQNISKSVTIISNNFDDSLGNNRVTPEVRNAANEIKRYVKAHAPQKPSP